MAVTVGLAAAFGACVALLCALYPGIDLWVTAQFYDPVSGLRFPLSQNEPVEALRWFLLHLPHVVTIAALLALIGNMFGVPLARRLPPRQALFLLATLIMIPGLLVNGVLKEHWGRPRPGDVVQFRGADPFWPWWKPGGPCSDNCSFVSGEVAATAWLTAAASLAPPPVRPVAMAAAVAATALSALLRVGFGRHWFSDAVIAACLTIVLVGGARWLFLNTRGPVWRRAPATIETPQQ